jgi:hypothetical protein
VAGREPVDRRGIILKGQTGTMDVPEPNLLV